MPTQTIVPSAPAPQPAAANAPEPALPGPVGSTEIEAGGRRLEQDADRRDLELIAGVER